MADKLPVARRLGLGRIAADDPKVRQALDRVVEALKAWNGESRDPLERVITLRDLRDARFSTNAVTPFLGAGDDDSPVAPITPIAPTGFLATAAFRTVIAQWGPPGYDGHALTEVWRNTEDNLGNAVFIGAAVGRVWSDDQVQGGVTYYYWARHVSTTETAGPFNATAGTPATPPVDVEFLLAELSGQIAESELTSALTSRIDLIDGPDTLTGSVDARIASEATLRSDADSALASDISQLSTTVDGNTTTIETHTTSIDGLQAQFTVKIDNNGAIAGFGLASTATDDTADGAFSEFFVNADRFAILPQGGDPATDAVAPFIVDGGTVFIDEARIRDGVIKSAQIESVAADKLFASSGTIAEALIGDAEITDAMIANIIQSTTFSSTTGWRLDKSGDIEAASIVIRDTDGNTILSSGRQFDSGIVDVLQAVNAPAQAGADRTAENTAAAITNQGNFATLDKISAANIGTYMNSAAIQEAYIANAAVGTLKIQGQAVTFAKSSFTSGSTTLLNGSFKIIQNFSATTSGAPVEIHAVCYGDIEGASTGSSNTTASISWEVRLLVDGAIVFNRGTVGSDSGIKENGGKVEVDASGTAVITARISLPAGSHAFSFQAIHFRFTNNSSTVEVNRRYLRVMELKR